MSHDQPLYTPADPERRDETCGVRRREHRRLRAGAHDHPDHLHLLVEILARGDDWVVVNKPAGVFVHRTSLSPDRDVMLTRVRDHLGQHVYPVHRLDRPTSGCLLFATSSSAARVCQQALADGQKTYLALVRGCAGPIDGMIDRALRPDGGGEEKEANTTITVLGRSKQPRCSLIQAQPHTGRFHQIRRHLRGLNHPVLMDSTHGDTRANRLWRPRGLHRLFLHCARLRLPHPDGLIDVIAPLPPDLSQVFAALPFADQARARVPEFFVTTSHEGD